MSDDGPIRYHVVKPGETLGKIARDYYGDAAKWETIYHHNTFYIQNPNHIYPGQRLAIPYHADKPTTVRLG